MFKLILGLLALALFGTALGACGGKSAAASDAAAGFDGRVTVDGNPVWDGAHPGDFIAADVDGVNVRGEFEPRAGTNGLADGQIWLNAGTTSNLNGWLLYIQNSVGTSACPPDWIALFEGATKRTDYPGGNCSVTVTAAAPALGDLIDGTFTASLATPPNPPSTVGTAYVVTNGAFHVTRNFQ